MASRPAESAIAIKWLHFWKAIQRQLTLATKYPIKFNSKILTVLF